MEFTPFSVIYCLIINWHIMIITYRNDEGNTSCEKTISEEEVL